jgi:hypothetical protein
MVSVTDPYDRSLGFLDRSRYFSIKYFLSCTYEAEWNRSRPTASQKIWQRRESKLDLWIYSQKL